MVRLNNTVNTAVNPLALGVDLGGTKIELVLANREGRVVAQQVVRTEAERGMEAVLANLYEGIRLLLSQVVPPAGPPAKDDLATLLRVLQEQGYEVIGLGLGVAAVLSSAQGVVHEAPNLGWREVPLRKMVEERTGLPVWLENDTNVAALGEYRFGAGQRTSPMVYLGLGTGIGAGIIIDGQLYRGIGGGAGEVGHIVIEPEGPPCGSGHPGCWEALASGTAIGRMAREAIERGRGDTLLSLAGGDPVRVTGRIVAEALCQGDGTAREIIQKAGAYLGMGLASVINFMNPALIVIGGGVAARLLDPLLEAARPEIERRAFPALWKQVRIVPAGLKETSAALGAASLPHFGY
jgi:glucokinase